MKFKVGDRVRYINNDYGEEYFKKAATITHISLSGALASIKFDFNGNTVSAWISDEIELLPIEEKTQVPAPESETKVLTDKIAKLEKQIKLLKIMLQAQGYDDLELVLELLD